MRLMFYKTSKSPKWYAAWFSGTNVSFTIPAGTYYVDISACGSGGGGGLPDTATNRGGGGKGGQIVYVKRYAVTPGQVFRINIGTPGSAGFSGETGGYGVATTLNNNSGGQILRANGGDGGAWIVDATSNGNDGKNYLFGENINWMQGLTRIAGNFAPDPTVLYGADGGDGGGGIGGSHGGGNGATSSAVATDGASGYGTGGGGGYRGTVSRAAKGGGYGHIIIRGGFE